MARKLGAGEVEVIWDQAAVDAVLKGPTGMVAKALLRIGAIGTGEVKRAAPVDTGRLRSGVAARLGTLDGQLAVFIGTDVDYARFNEPERWLLDVMRRVVARFT